MQHLATIRSVINNWPAQYFAPGYDGFYVFKDVSADQPTVADNSATANQVVSNQIINSPRPISLGQAAAAGAIGGLVGGLIQASAEETQKRSAEFPSLLKKSMPNLDMRQELIAALKSSLEAKGVSVRLANESHNLPLRLHWAAKNEKGEPLPTGSLVNSPAVDADVLVQIAPIAVYAAPGPLNPYTRRIGIAIAMFDGRTRQFLGWQAFPFKPEDSRFEYRTYNGLIEDLPAAGPALREGLMSLVARVSAAISGKPL